MKTIILFLALLSSLFFVNYKDSKGVRVIAFSEDETPADAWLSWINMILVAVLWTIYFTCF